MCSKLKTCLSICVLVLMSIVLAWQPAAAFEQTTATSATPQNAPAQADNPSSPPKTFAKLPHGKKLILKDGSFQMIREYQRDGDRVRYYSIDSGSWQEMPAALVDWDATQRDEEFEKHRDDGLIAAEEKREQERVIPQLDVDASVEAAPGIFIPDGDGLFAFDAKQSSR